MARFAKDRGSSSISIGPAIPATSVKENAGRTPANPGNTTGAGDEFVVVGQHGSGFKLPANVEWDYSMSGGTLTALTITLEASNDADEGGTAHWYTLDTGSVTTTAGESRNVSGVSYKCYRLNITTFTPNTGSPVIVGRIAL